MWQRSSNTRELAIGGGAARRTHPWLIRAADVARSHRARSRLAAAIRQTARWAKRRMLGGGHRVRASTPLRTIKHHTLTRQSHRHAAAARCRTTRPSVTLATPLLRGAPRPFRHSRRDVRRHSARSENTGVLHHGRPTPCRLDNPAAARSRNRPPFLILATPLRRDRGPRALPSLSP